MKIKPHVVASDTYISVSWVGDKRAHRATASADYIDNKEWWLSRCLVQPQEIRGQSIGSQLIENLKKKIPESHRLIVSPGGYDQNLDRQMNFYRKCGFKDCDSGLFWSVQEDR